jgi:hypothetical protein
VADPADFPDQHDEKDEPDEPTEAIGWLPWMEVQFEAMPLDLASALIAAIGTAAEGLGYSAVFREESGFGRVFFFRRRSEGGETE